LEGGGDRLCKWIGNWSDSWMRYEHKEV